LREQPLWQEFRGARANENIVIRGDISEYLYVICNGWAFRYYQLADGGRQILYILLAGELFSAVTAFEEKLHFSVQALTEVRFALFKRTEVTSSLPANPAISFALTQSCIAHSNDVDELLTVVGRRSAEQRLAYLFLHIMKRVAIRSDIREQRYAFPLRRQDIAEIIGLTPVHVSRVMGRFRNRGLIELSGGVLTVLNPAELERIGTLK
jgi:CRP-like cAMP-binding protein